MREIVAIQAVEGAMFHGLLYHLDRDMVAWAHERAVHHEALTRAVRWWADIVSPVVLRAVAVVVGGLLLWRGRAPAAIFLNVVVWGSSVLGWALRTVVGRERPELPDPVAPVPPYESFPSLHAMTSLAFWGALLVLVYPHLATRERGISVACAVVLVCATGFSRVWLGVHYPTDVLAGWLLAGLVLAIVVGLPILARPTSNGSAPERRRA